MALLTMAILTGRLEHSLYIGPPRRAARVAILRRQLHRMPLRLAHTHGGEATGAIESVDALASELAARTARFSGADLLALCQRAAMVALQRLGTAGADGAADAVGAVAADAMDTTDTTDATGAAGAADAALSVELERADFEQALREVSPSLTGEMLDRLHAWAGSRSSTE